MKKTDPKKQDKELEKGLAGKPKTMTFDEYCQMKEDVEDDTLKGLEFSKDTVQTVYDRYMPLVWKRASSQKDLRQIVAMVERDAANHPLANQSTVSGLSNRRGKDITGWAGM